MQSIVLRTEEAPGHCLSTDIKNQGCFYNILVDYLRRRTEKTSYLSSVYKLLSCIIVHAKNFQEWVRFTEEILKWINGINVFSPAFDLVLTSQEV